MTNDDDIKIIKEKTSLALQKSLKLHITLKNELWRNGFIKEISADFFIFVDDVIGERPIFFLDVAKVEPYMEDKRDVGK